MGLNRPWGSTGMGLNHQPTYYWHSRWQDDWEMYEREKETTTYARDMKQQRKELETDICDVSQRWESTTCYSAEYQRYQRRMLKR